MPLNFKVNGDVRDFEQKLKRLPAEAEKVGQRVERAMNDGMRRAATASTQTYIAQSRARFAAMTGGGTPGDPRRAMRERAENARAQMALDLHEERSARRRETEARRMDAALARTRAQRARMEQESRAGGRFGLLGMTARQSLLLGGGLALGHQALNAGREYNEDQSRIRPGLSRDTHGQMRDWRTQAAGVGSMSDRAALQAKMQSDIQSEMERFRNESTDQGAIANTMDGLTLLKNRFTGSKDQTHTQQRNEAFSSRIHAMTQAARAAQRMAEEGQDEVGQAGGAGAPGAWASLFDRVRNLKDEQKGLNIETEKGVKRFQELDAKIKTLSAGMDTYGGIMHANMSAEMGSASFKTRGAGLRVRNDFLTRFRGRASASELPAIDAEQADVARQMRENERGEFFANVNAGLMGPNARREGMRAMNREQREINRQKRMDSGQSGQNARAFQSEMVNPTRGIRAEQDKQADPTLQEILHVLRDRLKFPTQ